MSFLKSVLLRCLNTFCAKIVFEIVSQMLANVRMMYTNVKFKKVWKSVRVKLKE